MQEFRCLVAKTLTVSAMTGVWLTGMVTPGLFAQSGRTWAQSNSRVVPTLAQRSDEQTNIQVYQKAGPAVVAIRAGDSSGSGSILTPTGLVLTNAHVVGNNRTVQVRLADDREFTGDVIGYARNQVDLAAIQLRGNPTNLPTITIAPPGSVQVGQQAYAIGNPFGLAGTFTTGIVSRIDRERNLIQTDAAINPGNSGGPLLDSQGRLIGVNTSIFTTPDRGGNLGIGFAIPVSEVNTFLTALETGTAASAMTISRVPGSKAPLPIALNNTITGELSANSDILDDGSYFNSYTFSGRRGQRIEIEMRSQELDSYLILLSEENAVLHLEDDDSAGAGNARLVTTLPADGTYLILANSFAQGERGRYNLTLREVAASSGGMGASGLILQEQGILAPGDNLAPDNTFYDTYTFLGQAGQSVTISLDSTDFDPYLALLDSSGNLISENDDISFSNNNAEITLTLPLTDNYIVIVNGFEPQDQGRYTLTVR